MIRAKDKKLSNILEMMVIVIETVMIIMIMTVKVIGE